MFFILSINIIGVSDNPVFSILTYAITIILVTILVSFSKKFRKKLGKAKDLALLNFLQAKRFIAINYNIV